MKKILKIIKVDWKNWPFGNRDYISKIHLLPIFLFVFSISLHVNSQGINDYERIKVEGNTKHIFVGLDLSPDGEHIAISGVKSFPFYIYNWKDRKVVKEFNVGNWYAGSMVKYSLTGKYILLQQLFYMDLAPNKDREVKFEIINAQTGQRMVRFDDYHAVAFTSDEQYVLALTGNEVSFWNIETGKKEKSFKVQNASNGLAISPDGNTIAVSHHISEEALAKDPRYKKDKKGRKAIAKYKQEITLYDAQTFEKKFSVNEYYDIVYRLEFAKDGKILICMSIPHVKIQQSAKRQSFINVIDGETGEALRRGYTSLSNYEPDFKLSESGKYFGVVSQADRFLELHIYNTETKKMEYRFTQSFRLFEKNDGELAFSDSRASFVFLPGEETIVMTMGNRLIYWNFKSEKL